MLHLRTDGSCHVRDQHDVAHALGPPMGPVTMIYRDGQYMMHMAATKRTSESLVCRAK